MSVALIAGDGVFENLSCFSRSKDVVDGVLPSRTARGEPLGHIFLNLEVLGIDGVPGLRLPIKVSCNVSFLSNGVREILERTFVVAPQ